MSNYKGYNKADNERRKANNTGDTLGWGKNTNVKAYSNKPGQLSAKQQANLELKKFKPVKARSLKDMSVKELEALAIFYGEESGNIVKELVKRIKG